MTQLVRNLPEMQETWVLSLGLEDPLEKGKSPHSSVLAWRIPWTVYCMGSQESHTTEQISLSLSYKVMTFNKFTELCIYHYKLTL